ncbi:MAG: LysM peptidoglycan-binding domain-containing protein [Chloroflexota bacterium]
MGKLKVLSLLPLIALPLVALIVSSCNLGAATPAALGTPIIATTGTVAVPVVRLITQATNAGTTFNTVGQIINYSYSVTNTGIVPLNGPVSVIDDKAQVTCPNVNTVGNLDGALDPNESLVCTSAYPITQEDLTRGSVTSLSTATVGGFSSSPVTATVTFAAQTSAVPTTATIPISTLPTFTSPSGLTRGTTITHAVVKDEWMIQIARCYGADFDAVRLANTQVIDPDIIEIGERLSVPNIGSNGTIYGPPCVGHHTVVSGDTWASIAQRYNADVVVLQAANPGGLVVGAVLKIPLNSAGSSIPVTGTTTTPSLTPTPTITFTPSVTSTASMTLTPTITLPAGTTTTPSTPSPTVTGTVAAQGTRITFPAGSNTTNVTNTLPAQGTARYILAATQGQTLTIEISAQAGKVALSITGPAGTKIKDADTNLTWTGAIPATGDYTLDLVTVLATTDIPYSMDVTLTGP